MSDSINSVDIFQMAVVLYVIKKAQSIEEDVSKTLIEKTFQKLEDNKDKIRDLEKELFPWLGSNIDTVA